jgi:hypothetical protein
MKTGLIALLVVLSLAANVWLFRTKSAVAPAASGDQVVRRATSSGSSGTAPVAVAPQPVRWRESALTLEATRALAADLRAAGFPDHVVAKFVVLRLRERAALEMAKLPYWELMGNGRKVRARQSELDAQVARQQEEILGEAGSPAALYDPTARLLAFGELSDAKVNALLRIQADYREVGSEQVNSAGSMTSEEFTALRERMRTIQRERYADMKAALSPEEFAEFEARNSASAGRVQDGLKDLAVSEEEYRALYAAQRAREPNAEQWGGYSRNEVAADLAATYAFNEKVRATLGEERADVYLKASDPSYAQAAKFAAKTPGFSREKLEELYRLQNEASIAWQESTRSPASTGARNSAATQARFAELNQRLDVLLGSEAAKAYRADGNGAHFNRRSRPAPPRG